MNDVALNETNPTVIDVYADVWCPFTHVGLRRLIEHRATRGASFVLRVHPWPLELVNGVPMDAEFIGEEIDDLRAQVSPELFGGFRTDRFPTSTLPALALAEVAYGESLAAGEALSLALRDALFEEGRDVSAPEVLAELANRHQLRLPTAGDEITVREALNAGRERGVVGSPHFFTPSGGFFCPALDIKRIDGHLRIRADVEGFERFVDELASPAT